MHGKFTMKIIIPFTCLLYTDPLQLLASTAPQLSPGRQTHNVSLQVLLHFRALNSLSKIPDPQGQEMALHLFVEWIVDSRLAVHTKGAKGNLQTAHCSCFLRARPEPKHPQQQKAQNLVCSLYSRGVQAFLKAAGVLLVNRGLLKTCSDASSTSSACPASVTVVLA